MVSYHSLILVRLLVTEEVWQAFLPSFSTENSGQWWKLELIQSNPLVALAVFGGMLSMWRSKSRSTNGWLHSLLPQIEPVQLEADFSTRGG